MKNRTILVLSGWTILGATVAIAISYLNAHVLVGVCILWMGGTYFLLVRSLFATQHKQSKLLAQAAKRNAEDRAELRRLTKSMVELASNAGGTSRALQSIQGAEEESQLCLRHVARTLQAIELNQEHIADWYLGQHYEQR